MTGLCCLVGMTKELSGKSLHHVRLSRLQASLETVPKLTLILVQESPRRVSWQVAV